jgi:hypothetical protein
VAAVLDDLASADHASERLQKAFPRAFTLEFEALEDGIERQRLARAAQEIEQVAAVGLGMALATARFGLCLFSQKLSLCPAIRAN